MTEYDWLTSTDPQAMLTALLPTRSGDTPPIQLEGGRGNPSDRKLRLFACACVRQAWHLLADYEKFWCSRRAVEVAEESVDGKATSLVLETVLADAGRVASRWMHPRPEADNAANAAEWCCTRDAAEAAAGVLRYLPTRKIVQSNLLREIIGNPFRLHNPWPPGSEQYGWLVWQDNTIPRLAQRIYNERDWDAMPILGDALEEAGCEVEEIVRHCRGGGPHVRGCWVLDLILGKE